MIPRREPPTKGCKQGWRDMLSVAWPAARMMVEKALEMAYNGKGSVNTYLLERYFGPDAMTNIVPIRQGYQNILSKWFDWDPTFECHEQDEARCPNKNPHKITLAYVMKGARGRSRRRPTAACTSAPRGSSTRSATCRSCRGPSCTSSATASTTPATTRTATTRPSAASPPTKAIRNADSYAQYARTVFNLSI